MQTGKTGGRVQLLWRFEKWLGYDNFKFAHNLEACQILATLLQNVARLLTISWGFDLHQLKKCNNGRRAQQFFILQQRSLIFFFNTAGLAKLGGWHAFKLVYNKWMEF